MIADHGNCRACSKAILWVRNENGKAEPFDARPCRVLVPSEPGVADYRIRIDGHLPHFVTCPQAGRFKTASGGPGVERERS